MPFCNGITAVVGPTIGLILCAGALDVPKLDAEQDEIDRADGCGIVGGPGRIDNGFPAAALDAQAAPAYCCQMSAARDEGHVSPRAGQCRTERSADTAGSDHGYAHGGNSVLLMGTGSRGFGAARQCCIVADPVAGIWLAGDVRARRGAGRR